MGEQAGFIHAELTEAAHVARITLARPEEHNALSLSMVTDFLTALDRFSTDDDVKAIVIDATGPDLCAGLDSDEIGLHHEHVAGIPSERVPSLRARLRAADDFFWGADGIYTRVLKCPKVTVLAAKGRCFDAGLYLTLFCDIVVATDDARFGSPRWQHVGVDGDVAMLIATVGRKRANELMFAGATWDAEQALTAGLITQRVPGPESRGAALDIARTVSTIMRDGIAAEKYLTLASIEKMGIGAGLATASIMTAMSSTVHFRAGEFNFLRAKRDVGLDEALKQAERAKTLT